MGVVLDIRHLRKTDLPAYGQLMQYAFNGSNNLRDRYVDFVGHFLASTFGVFEGKRLMAGMWYYPFDMRVGADVLPMGGVAAVATWPDARNAGLVARLMKAAHDQMRKEGRALGALMPFRNSFYGRMGYADVFYHNEWNFAPEDLVRPARHAARARMVDGHRVREQIEAVHQSAGGNRFGTVRRDKVLWTARLLPDDDQMRKTFLIERGRDLVGFVVARHAVDPGSQKRDLFVEQAVWCDPDALRAILELIWVHRDHLRKVKWYLPTDVDLFPFFKDAITPDVRLKHKMMFKLVDLKGAIEQRIYPDDLDGEVTLNVEGDATGVWNTGYWRITFGGGSARVQKLRQRPRGRIPSCDIQTLSILYSGYRSATELAALGSVSFPANERALLERAFPRGVPYMQEWF